MKKTILFDLDGTLTDSGEGIINCVIYALERFGLPIPARESLRYFVGPPLHESFIKQGVPVERAEEAVAVYRERYVPTGMFENTPYPGVRELLEALKAEGHTLFVASSKPEWMCVEILKHFDLAKYFDQICGATMDTSRTNKEAVIEYLIQENGKTDNMIMVGDTKFDVLGAKAHSIPCVGVSWGYGSVDEMQQAGAANIAYTMNELQNYLTNANTGGADMTLNERVLAMQEDLLATLQENLRIPSVEEPAVDGAPYGVPCRESLDHVLKIAASLGFRTENVDGHMGWCEYGEGEEMIAVLGHLDVVPAGEGWSFDPWGGEIRDGRIFGRGTMDDKGPSIAALYSLAALRDSGLPLKRRIRILFGCNEETGARDVKYYLSKGGEIPVMGFTPDAEYPVINGEKGIINVTYSRSYRQTGDLKLISINGGTAANVTPAFAMAKLSCSQDLAQRIAKLYAPSLRFKLTDYGVSVEAFGVSAHGSTPWQGENAIGRLMLALDNLPFEGEMQQVIHFLAEKLGMETTGKSAGIYLHDEVSGDLSLNWGTLNADEHKLSMVINYRYPVTKNYSDCAPALDALFAKAGFEKTAEAHKEKLYIPADSDLVKILLKVYKDHTGIDGKPVSIGGGTYAKSLPNILAFGPIFPGDEVREHKPDEFIEIPKLMKNAQIIASAMYEMAK